MSPAWGETGGKDTDGDGKPELFVSGNAQDGTDERRTFVYESNGDGGFVRVASLGFYDGYQGASWIAVTNLDGVGREEFVVFLFPGLFVYRAVAPGQWMLSCIIPTLGDENFFMSFDANRNEREELFWSESGMAPFASTVVLEHTEVCPTDAPREVVSVRSLEVFPNPCHNQSTLLLPRLGRTTVSAVATFDAAGRLVARSAVRADTSTVPWPPVPLSSGVYFVRLEDSARATLAQGRVMVLQ